MELLREIPCLDKGYVRLASWMPWNMPDLYEAVEEGKLDRAFNMLNHDDLGSVNAAKASFAKQSEDLGRNERRLIAYLAEHGHTSPFRHLIVRFEVKAPLMVANQWRRYVVGSAHSADYPDVQDDSLFAWNEASRRYVTSEPEFYVPKVWRGKAEDKKQGSGEPVDETTQQIWTNWLRGAINENMDAYLDCLNQGIAPEQARLFLPAYGLYIYWHWTASLGAVCHLLNERLGEDAQEEIQEYAQAVYRLVSQPAVYPLSVAELVKKQKEGLDVQTRT